MTYEVRVSARAERDIEQAYLWYRENAPGRADAWYNGMLDAIESLERDPQAHPLIPEQGAFRFEARHLLYGRRRNWRAVFTIRGRTVIILHVRHSARHPLTEGDLP